MGVEGNLYKLWPMANRPVTYSCRLVMPTQPRYEPLPPTATTSTRAVFGNKSMSFDGRQQRSHEVALVIPTRERWRFMRTALGCALAQEGVDARVVVVEGGRSDATLRVVAPTDTHAPLLAAHTAVTTIDARAFGSSALAAIALTTLPM